MLLTNKYGESFLPKTIPVEEFESVLEAVQKYFDNRYEAIHSKLEDLEAELGAPSADKQQETIVTSQSTVRTSSETSDLGSEGERTDMSDRSSGSRSEQNVTIYRKEGEVRRNQELIKILKEQEAALPNPTLLTTWYKRDTNAVPGVYRLMNIRFVSYFDTVVILSG